MKKIILFLLFVQIFLFVACKPDAPEPVNPNDDEPVQNNIDNSWSYDAESHWHDQSDLASHKWNEVIIKEATYDEDGSTLCVCTVCGYEKTKVIAKLSHIHTFSDEWTFDEGFHWHAATCGHEDERKDEEEHNWVELEEQSVEPTKLTKGKKVYVCSVCGESKAEIIPDLPPDTITGFSVVSTEKECATVKWKNPSDSDFVKVVISYGEGKKVEIPGLPNEEVTKSFIGLENGNLYVFTINAIDNNDNYSLPVKENVPVYGGLYGQALNGVKPGYVISSNLFGLDKTSEVAIIPQHTTALFGIPDNSSWNKYFPENEEVPENCKGAFVKGRKIRLDSFALGQYNVTEELWDRVMVPNANSSSRRNSKTPVIDDFYHMCIFCNELTKLVHNGDSSECVYYLDKELTELYLEENCHPFFIDYNGKPILDSDGKPEINYDKYKPVYPAYDYSTCKWAKKGYRLPTEAEWEYAARGGDPNKKDTNTKERIWEFAFAGVKYPLMLIDHSKASPSVTEHVGYNADGNLVGIPDESLREYEWLNYNPYASSNFVPGHYNSKYDSPPNAGFQEVGLLLPSSLNLYDMCGNVTECLYDSFLEDVTSEDSKFLRGGYVSNPIGSEIRDYDNASRSFSYRATVEILYYCVSYRGLGLSNYYTSGFNQYSFRLARSLD